jgi:drug/metabolite transporter (DMT)-like permease
MTFLGVFLGLIAALFQSLSYILSKNFLQRSGDFPHLLVYAHIIMGLMSAALLPVLWTDRLPPLSVYIFPSFLCALFYILGQAALFMALRRADSSHVSPLLGLKVVILALVSMLVLGASYSAAQWAAVFLCLLGAGLLNRFGGKIPFSALLFTLGACVGYSFSDIYIKVQFDIMGDVGVMRKSAFAAALCYAMCGAGAVVWAPFLRGGFSGRGLRAAFPFAIVWFTAMIFIFSCMGLIGPVYGNIVQSSRGLLSIAMGYLIAAAGMSHLEAKLPKAVFARRAAAGLIIFAAIVLFQLGARK